MKHAPLVISNRSSRWLGLFAQRQTRRTVLWGGAEIAQPHVGATLWMRGRWNIAVFCDQECV